MANGGSEHTAGSTGAVAQGSATAAAEVGMARATAAVTRARSWCARARCRGQWRLEGLRASLWEGEYEVTKWPSPSQV